MHRLQVTEGCSFDYLDRAECRRTDARQGATISLPSYSLRLVRPFLTLLRKHPHTAGSIVTRIEELDPEARVPIIVAHQMLERAERLSGDRALGVKAGLELRSGDLGVVDYAARTAAHVEQSLEVACRYERLSNDAIQSSWLQLGGRVFVRFASLVVVPRGAAEFQLGAALAIRKGVWPEELFKDLDVWLTGPQPVDVSVHARAFAPARVHFACSFSGFSFDARFLRAPLRSADATLHNLLREHLEMELSTLPQLETRTQHLRALLVAQLPGGNATIEQVAQRMQTSVSTLGRLLEAEGTTFSDVLDELRQQLALEYLASPERSVAEVASLTGFSGPAAFHRAFRRWTGKTPLEYRRERRGCAMPAAGARQLGR